MNVHAALSILTCMIAFIAGTFVYFRNPKSIINKMFVFVCLAHALQFFIEFGYRQSHIYEQALFWWKMDFFWPLCPSSILLFVLSFTGKTRYLNSKLVYATVYLPTIILIVLELLFHPITGSPVREYWGWTFSIPENTTMASLAYIWILGVHATAAATSIHYLWVVSEVQRRAQARFLTIAISLGFAGTIADSLLFGLSILNPPLAHPVFTIAIIFIGYAIWKYDMFLLTPSTAADNILATMTDALLLVSPEGKILSSNDAAQTLLGYEKKQLSDAPLGAVFSKNADCLSWLTSNKSEKETHWDQFTDMETSFITKDGQNIHASLSGSALQDDYNRLLGYVLIGRDITERKRIELELNQYQNNLEDRVKKRTIDLDKANENLNLETIERLRVEKERSGLEKQLQHVQRMDAIGRLAGGIAHDFNNLLFVITGYIESFIATFPRDDPQREDAVEIQKAARKARSLTQQLLAFSRKQVIQPRIINVNDALLSAKNLLGRIIEENIEMTFNPAAKAARVNMDPTQIDQIIVNLVVNARDAMPNGGELTIHTSNIKLKDTDFLDHPEAIPGSYILLTVSDTGCGMDEATLNKIFEPFFTTKKKGKGTGLGLSTVYGIAKQNRGFIEVKSKRGEGTSFDIYLPQIASDVPKEDQRSKHILTTGKETILLVEDEAMVRRMASQLLKKQGYKVLEAGSAKEALKLSLQFKDDIDLLFTDVVMPGMNGKQLSDRLLETKPSLRILFMSGYNEEIVDQNGCLESGIPLIQKPFSSSELYLRIREVLDA